MISLKKATCACLAVCVLAGGLPPFWAEDAVSSETEMIQTQQKEDEYPEWEGQQADSSLPAISLPVQDEAEDFLTGEAEENQQVTSVPQSDESFQETANDPEEEQKEEKLPEPEGSDTQTEQETKGRISMETQVNGSTVTVQVIDPGAGLAEEAYSFNGGWTWQKSNQCTKAEGYTWVPGTIVVRDKNGAMDYNRVSVTVEKDNTAPEMETQASGLTVTITASDADSGLAEEAYSFNGGWTWQKSNQYTAQGAYTWVPGTIQVRDKAGNVNYNRASVTVKGDTTAPQMEIQVSGLTVTVKASDSESGLAEEAYSFNGGWTWQKSNQYTAQGAYTWVPGTIVVRDKAGNLNYNRTSVVVKGDTTAPQMQTQVNGMTVTVTASDTESGLAEEAYSFNGGWTWQKSNQYTAQRAYTWVPGTIQVRDKAGNVNYNRSAVTVKGDTTPPQMQTKVEGLTLTVTASDSESGLAEEAYSFNGGWTWQKSNQYTTVNGYTWVPGTIQVRDKAGNVNYNRSTVEIKGDTTAPTFECTVSGGEHYVTSRVVTVTSTDEGGLADKAYSFDGGVTWQSGNSVEISSLKTWVPGTIQVRDKAGNVNYNRTNVRVGRLIQVDNYGDSATVRVLEDEDGGAGYPPVQFSFDGGVSWQSSNSITIDRDKSWVPGTIQAKDFQSKVNYNGETIDVFLNAPLVIDVSAWQQEINWEAVRADNVRYAIIRAVSWKGDSPAADVNFIKNVKAAKNAGIKVGAYIYTYALNEEQVQAEIAVFKALMQTLRQDGYTLDLPVFVDHEDPSLITGIPTKQRRTELLRLEMVLLDHAGHLPGMYMSTSWAQTQVDGAALRQEGYLMWIADWRGYNGWGPADFWQFTSKGQVNGIIGNVDLSYMYNNAFR